MKLHRSSGILLHPTSLPGPFHVGDFGQSARKFVDMLADAGQTWWQILPLTPPGYGGSPYGSSSSFAINLALVDLVWVLEKGWITDAELDAYKENEPPEGAITEIAEAKRELLYRAYKRCSSTGIKYLKKIKRFRQTNSWWLEDDALYFALRREYDGKPWYEWPDEYIACDEEVLLRASQRLSQEIEKYVFAQWVANEQWSELRFYAKDQGVKFIGDLPIFVAMDSSDVWAQRSVFEVDDAGNASVVAGVPPDYFSKTGQKWGNPLYRWEDQFQNVMRWWIERVRRALNLVDLIRIDHFRAFVDYWEVPADAPTAETGEWKEGPGEKFFNALRDTLGEVPFIAEDLGIVSEEVYELRDEEGLPGMKVLEFAFDGNPEHPFLPHNYPELCVAYAGTHDNNTIVGWRDHDASPSELHNARVYLSSSDEELPRKMMGALAESPADLVIFQVQDIFELPGSCRMNTPGVPDGNWSWRMSEEMLDTNNPKTNEVWHWLKELTVDSERS